MKQIKLFTLLILISLTFGQANAQVVNPGGTTASSALSAGGEDDGSDSVNPDYCPPEVKANIAHIRSNLIKVDNEEINKTFRKQPPIVPVNDVCFNAATAGSSAGALGVEETFKETSKATGEAQLAVLNFDAQKIVKDMENAGYLPEGFNAACLYFVDQARDLAGKVTEFTFGKQETEKTETIEFDESSDTDYQRLLRTLGSMGLQNAIESGAIRLLTQ